MQEAVARALQALLLQQLQKQTLYSLALPLSGGADPMDLAMLLTDWWAQITAATSALCNTEQLCLPLALVNVLQASIQVRHTC